MSHGALLDKVKLAPDSPGVYQMKDSAGDVLYVGKARSLRQRLRSYFQNNSQLDAKVRALVAKIVDFDYILTDTEREALV
ncbi:MAG: GIY-YIG nuclease family protein, partial [bacterium]|nr:GIY-YIG nuclease family protein [bacterium]